MFTCERCFSVRITTWRTRFKSKGAVVVSFGIVMVLFILNFPDYFFVTFGMISLEAEKSG